MIEMSGAVIIPLSAIPAQRLQCVLNGQNCTITIKSVGNIAIFLNVQWEYGNRKHYLFMWE